MPTTPHPLDILFLTNFSDYCYKVIPAIAQMADGLPMRLTLMHVYDPRTTTARKATEALQSFFPEADRYHAGQRVVVPGPLVEAVRRHVSVHPVNLIVAPASDPIGMPRLGDRSLRAQLLEACGVPLWTMGRGVTAAKLLQPPRHVACWLDYRGERHPHLAYAVEYAQRLGATLHLLQGLPAIDEGLMLPPGHPDKPLDPDRAAAALAALCAKAPVDVHVHVASGEGRRTLAQLLRTCDADIVFLRDDEWLLSRWLGLGMGLRLGDASPCPAIYVGERPSIPVWRLESPPSRVATGAAVAARGPAAVGGSHAAAMTGLASIGLA